MDLEAFAGRRRLRLKRDGCGDPAIVGKRGQIYEYGPGRLGVLMMPGRPRIWSPARKALRAAGCRIIQNGDWEGAARFDPENEAQVRLAIRVVAAKPRRRATAAQLAGPVKMACL